MSTQRLPLIIAGVLVVLIVGLVAATAHAYTLPTRIGDQETVLLGQSRLSPGSAAAVRLVVRDTRTHSPIAGADVLVSLQAENGEKVNLYTGQTDAQGLANARFDVPAHLEGTAQLSVQTRSQLGSDNIERDVQLQRSFKLLLSSDKPLYQPGQVIHIHVLCVSAFDLKPAGGQVQLAVADAKGNKVFQKSLPVSAYGIAAADFQLADEVNTGNYKLTAQMGDTLSERSVSVLHYVLPKFKVTLTTDQAYYTPGQQVTGRLTAAYFFGKPVQAGQVRLSGFTFDVARQQTLDLQSQTDDQGEYSFSFNLPDYFVGGADGGRATFILEASVTDSANHTEQNSLSIPVAQSSIVIQAVPESGLFKPGLENIVYVVTMYPDGTPAPSQVILQMDGQDYTLETSEVGLGSIKVTPQTPYAHLEITARDRLGQSAQLSQDFYGEYQSEYVLLRPEHVAYRVGESLQLDVLASTGSGTVYLDVVHAGQTVLMRSAELEDGRAHIAIDLSEDLAGTLTLHAYKLLPDGQIVRDTRIVLVDPANALTMRIQPDRDTYRPGETAQLTFQVEGVSQAGPAQAALGLAIVDESVFALQEQDAGFARLYFLLEKELMTPRYDLHGFTPADALLMDDTLLPADTPTLRQARDNAATAALAAATAASSAATDKWIEDGIDGGVRQAMFSLNANSRNDKMKRIYELQQQAFGMVTNATFSLLLIVPLGIAGLGMWSLRRENTLKSALIVSALAFATMVLVLVLLPPTPWGENNLLAKLGYFLGETLDRNVTWVMGGIAIIGLISLLGLAVYAWRAGDGLTGTMLVLLIAYAIALLVAFVSTSSADVAPPEALGIACVLAYLLAPLAFAVRATGFGLRKQVLPALASLGVSGLALPLIAGSLFTYSTFPNVVMGLEGGAQMMDGDVMLRGAAPAAPHLALSGIVKQEEARDENGAVRTDSSASDSPRLRQFFPETLFWMPEAVTDEQGRLIVEVPLADSITTWRLSAIASAPDGRIGSANAGLRVFQEFFIDLDLPVALTQNDEIAAPVAVYNYLPEAQTVTLRLEPGDWFELKDQAEKQLTIGPGDVSVAYFRIKAVQFGRHALTVTGQGSRMSDAIQKEVTVHPDGKRFEFAHSDRLENSAVVEAPIPAQAIPGAVRLTVKVYPGVMSQIVEGLEEILRMPFGCFEQTSSTTYPNVLAMDYIRTTGGSTPEVQMKAEQYINLGYQRLTSFEVDGGGFSLFGDAPADRMLTAYGLQEFHDMSRVYSVDPALIERAAQWLLAQQSSDGTWENDRGLVHESTWQQLKDDRLPVTAYIAWSLAEAGYGQNERVQAAMRFVRQKADQALDPYVLALVANALVVNAPNDAFTQQTLDRLAAMAEQSDGAAYWASQIATMMGGQGQTGSIETTALAAYALVRGGARPDIANAALTYLVRSKDPHGTWHTTQATVLSLKALLAPALKATQDIDASVTVSLNGGQARDLHITRDNYDVVHSVTFDDVSPSAPNQIQLSASAQVGGQADGLMYQVSGSYYLPWSEVRSPEPDSPSDVDIQVSYDRTALRVNDTVGVRVEVKLNAPGVAQQALIDLGIPPGFEVLAEELQARIASEVGDTDMAHIRRYELTGRQMLVYVQNLSSDQPLVFSYRLRARLPIIASIPSSAAYDYYNPQVRGELAPALMVVEE